MSKKQPPSKSFDIANEDQAIKLLQQALANQFGNTNVSLNFKDWPTLRLEYKGDKFKGTITPDIAKAIVDLQETLNRVYMLAVHNTTSLQGLDQDTKQELALVATVNEGSSLLGVNLDGFAETLITHLAGKMNGTESVITVLGTVLMVTAGWAWKSYLQSRSDDKKIELENHSRLQLSQHETERQKILADAIVKSHVVRRADEMLGEPRNSFIRSATDADALTIPGGTSITGEEAQQLYRAPRSTSQDVQINGTFFIEGFKWASDKQTARLNLQRKDDGLTFAADLSVNALNEKQKARFKDGVIDRLEVYLSINGTMLHDKITTAKIVSITEQPTKN